MPNKQWRKNVLFALVVTVGMSLVATVVYASDPQQSVRSTQRVPLEGVVVGQEVLYPNGVMVSRQAGAGLSAAALDLDAVSPTAVIPCSAGYTCIYEHVNYGGRRLQWRDHGQLINLTDYGFNDKMSSWRNRNSVDARWYYNINGRGTARCMNAGASATTVGSDNDQASSLRIYTSSRGC